MISFLISSAANSMALRLLPNVEMPLRLDGFVGRQCDIENVHESSRVGSCSASRIVAYAVRPSPTHRPASKRVESVENARSRQLHATLVLYRDPDQNGEA